MLLYSYKGNYPEILPERIRLGNGYTRSDSSTFTNEEIEDAGYTGPYVEPEYNQNYETLSWDSNTLSFFVNQIPDEDLWHVVRSVRDNLLQETDWSQLPDSPLSENIKLKYKIYRQQLRDIPSTYTDPKSVVFPDPLT
jgi:hypothetical protein